MKKIITLAFFVILFLFSLLSAEPFKIIEESESYLILEFSLPDYEIVQQGDYDIVELFGSATMLEPGLPQLPFFSELISLPEQGDFQVVILDKKQKYINDIYIKPVDKHELVDDFPEYSSYKNDSFYNLSQWYPSQEIVKGETGYYRDNFFSSFKFYPVRFNPAGNEISVIEYARIKINFSGIKETSSPITQANFNTGHSLFINKTQANQWRIPRKQAQYNSVIRATGSVDAVQIIVDEEGIYKIDYDFLMDALVDYQEENELEIDWSFSWDNLDPGQLELRDEFGVIPIYFVGENDGSFDPGDYFEFYGNRHFGDDGYYDDYTSENVYTLRLIDGYGSRMAVENGGLQETDPTNYIVPVAFQETIHLEEQNNQELLGAQFSWNSSSYYREDTYFWDQVSAPDLALYPFELEYPYQSNIKRFTAKAMLLGLTFNPSNYNEINHQAIVRINSSIINNHEWSGQNEQLFESIEPISNKFLLNGTNTIYLSLPGVPGVTIDEVLLDYLDLTYWKEYKTNTDYLKFSKPSDAADGLFHFKLENFSSEEVFVYKLGASIMENLQVSSLEMEPPFKVEFQDVVTSNNLSYIACTDEMKLKPKAIRPDFVSDLKNPINQAEYIIITAEKFKDSEGTLQIQQTWQDQGVQTEVVSLQDIYDEFNSGIEAVESIKDFISYAYNYWSGDPVKYVTLLGDGILDERDNSVSRNYNLIPFRRVWVDDRGAIASDNWMGCIVGTDPVADVSISRINVWEESQIIDVAEKIQYYLDNPNYGDFWHSNITLCAGGNPSEGTFFAKQSERIREAFIPKSYRVNRVYCNTEDIPDSYQGNTTSLISNINDGTMFLQFMGHGGGRVWADYNLLNQADIATFNNENYPFVASLSCYGSAFNYPQSSCIGEELVLAAQRGAIAHVGFTGFGYKLADEVFGNHLNDAMFMAQKETIGEVMNYTKAKFFGDYGAGAIGIALIQGCGLLGEARVPLIYPEFDNDIELNDYIFNVGDTLQMSATVDPDITQGKFIIYDENDVPISLNEYYPFTLPVINETITASDFVISGNDQDIFSRSIRLYTSGDSRETVSMASFAVGQSAFANLEIIPEAPTYEDSIMIRGAFFDEDGINSIQCNIVDADSNFISSIPMELVEGNIYQLSHQIEPQDPGSILRYSTLIYSFDIEDNQGYITTTSSNNISLKVIDLYLRTADFVYDNGFPAIEVEIDNIGTINSGNFVVEVRDLMNNSYVLASSILDSVAADSRLVDYINLPILQGRSRLQIIINPNLESFSEINIFNNIINLPQADYNFDTLDQHEVELISLDDNLTCLFPGGLFDEETLIFLNTQAYSNPINQEDVKRTLLLNGDYSPSFEIGTSSTIYDSTESLPSGYEIELKFKLYSENNLRKTESNKNVTRGDTKDNYKVYRWEEQFDKWVLAGGQFYPNNNEVIFNADRFGIYTILENNDVTEPDIDINVEGQEFTYGGYISSRGILSFLLSDANGIDIFNDKIKVWLDGEEIANEELTISPTYGNLTNLPIKYQLDAIKGEHSLSIDCTDVNGIYNTRDINFQVNDEFDLINVANYPNPVKTKTIDIINSGRTRFTYVLTDDAEKVYLKIYTVNGRLVKTFKNLPASVGYHEYPRSLYGWDCTDKNGFTLANGVYFYRLTAVKGDKKIESTNKLAILK